MFFQKKFDFKAIYCHSYFAYNGQAVTDSTGNGSTANSNGRLTTKHAAGSDQQQSLLERDLVTLLITEMSTLHIYKSRQLRWASQLPQSYCHVQRANFHFAADCELIGCLTFLSSDGHLALAFLGTNPSVNIVNNVQSSLMNRRSSQRSGKQSAKSGRQSTFSNEDREQLFTNTQMDKEEFDKEMLELRKIINAYNSDFSSLIKLNAGACADGRSPAEENDLAVELANCRFDTMQDTFSKPAKLPEKLQSNNVIDLEFTLSSGKSLSNLIVNLNTANCFNITPNLHNLAKLESTSSVVQFRLFYDSLNKPISFRSNQIYLVVNYFNEKNLPRIHSKLIELPMTFFCRLQNQLAVGHSRAGSSTATSHNSSASQRSTAIDRVSERNANQSLLSKTLEQSLDQYLLESSDPARQSSNTIAFQFISKRSTICLSAVLAEMIGRNNLGKLHKKADEDGLKSNKVTVQFINSKLKLVHVEFVSSTEDGDKFENEKPTNDRLATYRVTIIGDDLHSNCIVFNLLIAKLNALCLDRAIERIQFSRSSLPIREYFELINLHLALRQGIATRKKQLEEHCERLRVIEKRILLKLKDRNNSNLSNLESLLNVQHQKVSSSSCFELTFELTFKLTIVTDRSG